MDTPRGKRETMGTSEKAAAAAEARISANAMGVAELRAALAALRVDSRSAVEKIDLVALYVKAKTSDGTTTGPSPSAASRAPPPPKPAARPTQKPAAKPAVPNNGPQEINWTNAVLMALMAIYGKRFATMGFAQSFVHWDACLLRAWSALVVSLCGASRVCAVYMNFFSGGGDGGGGAVEYSGARSTAYLDGAVLEVRTLGEFHKILKQHEEDTGLPVVVDFHSRGCGPCRQIAPYYSALAEELAGKACFLKVGLGSSSGSFDGGCMLRSMRYATSRE